MSAFYLEFLDHQLFCFLGYCGSVQESESQEVAVRGDEGVSAVETAEESHDGVESLVNFLITHLLETFLELVVTVEGHVVRSSIIVVHETLKCNVSRLLESHIRAECCDDHFINLVLEVEHLERELEWVFSILLIVGDFASLLHNVGLHFVDNELESPIYTTINFVHDIKLVEFLLIEHELAARLHESKSLSLFFDAFLKSYV